MRQTGFSGMCYLIKAGMVMLSVVIRCGFYRRHCMSLFLFWSSAVCDVISKESVYGL